MLSFLFKQEESLQAIVYMRVFSAITLDEIRQARVCIGVVLNLSSWSNESKRYMKVGESRLNISSQASYVIINCRKWWPSYE